MSLIDEAKSLFKKDIRHILLTLITIIVCLIGGEGLIQFLMGFEPAVSFEDVFLAILPQVIGIEVVGLALADHGAGVIESLILRCACGSRTTETPLSKYPRRISRIFQKARNISRT